MGNMYNRIFGIIKEKGTNPTALCRKAGVSRAVLSELKAGRTKEISLSNATKLAEALDVPVESLIGEENIKKESVNTDGLSEIDLETIDLIKQMSDEDRVRLANFAKALLASEPQD